MHGLITLSDATAYDKIKFILYLRSCYILFFSFQKDTVQQAILSIMSIIMFADYNVKKKIYVQMSRAFGSNC